MIMDKLSRALRYAATQKLKEAFEFAATLTADAPDGRMELSGGMYATVMSGNTTPAGEGLFEVHRRYIDLQVVLQGCEVLETAPAETLKPGIAYDADKDAEMLSGEGLLSALAGEGTFYLLYPEDAHRACKHHRISCAYKKAVVKIPVGE